MKWTVFVAETNGQLVGWTALSGGKRKWEVEHLWVLPEVMGKGIGKGLFRLALEECCQVGDLIRVESDPNAVGFYQAMDFEIVGVIGSVPEGRQLPVLEMVV